MDTDVSASNSSIVAESGKSSSDFIKSPSLTSSENDTEKEYSSSSGDAGKSKFSNSDFVKINNVNKVEDEDLTIKNDLNYLNAEKRESIEALINKYATNKKYPSSSNINIYSGDSSNKYQVSKDTSKSIFDDKLSNRQNKDLPNECRYIKINLLTDQGLEYKGIETSVDKKIREDSPTLVVHRQEDKDANKTNESGENQESCAQIHETSLNFSNKIETEVNEHTSPATSSENTEEVSETKLLEGQNEKLIAKETSEVAEDSGLPQIEEKETVSTANIEEELENIYEKGRVIEKEETFEVLLNVKRFIHGRMSVRSKGHYTFLVEAEADNKDDPGSKLILTKRFFIPGRVDMQKTSTSLSSDGILVITVPKLPPLKIQATSDIDRKERLLESDSSADNISSQIKTQARSSSEMKRDSRDEKLKKDFDRENERKLYESEDGYDSDEDVATRISRKADRYAHLSKEELGREWGDIRSMEKKYKEWLESRSKDEKYREWCDTKSKEEKHRDWFNTLQDSKWGSYKDFFNARKNIENLFEKKTKRRFEDDWFDRDFDWFDDLTRKEIGTDWFDFKGKSDDKFGNYRDRSSAKKDSDFFGKRSVHGETGSRFERGDDFFKSHLDDTKDFINETKRETNKHVYMSESSDARRPSFETSSKYYTKEESSSSSRGSGARSKIDRDEDEHSGSRSRSERDHQLGSRSRSMMEEMKNEFRRDSESSFEFPIIKRGHFFQDSFFDDARDDFGSVLERFFDRKEEKTRFGSLKEEFKIFDDLKERRKERRRPNTVVTEDEACYKIEVPVGDVDEDSLTVKELAGNEILIEGRSKSDGKTFKKQILFPLYGRADLQQATSSLLLSGLLIITIPKTMVDGEHKKLESKNTGHNERSEFQSASKISGDKTTKTSKRDKFFDEVEESFDSLIPTRLKTLSNTFWEDSTFHCCPDKTRQHERFNDDKLEFRKRRRKKHFTSSEMRSNFHNIQRNFDDDFFNFSDSTKNILEDLLPRSFSSNFFSRDFLSSKRNSKTRDPFSIHYDQFLHSSGSQNEDEIFSRQKPPEVKFSTPRFQKGEISKNELPKKFINEGEVWYKVEIPIGDLQENSLTVTEFGENEILVEGETSNGDKFKEKIFFPPNCDAKKAQAVLSIDGQLIVKVPTYNK